MFLFKGDWSSALNSAFKEDGNGVVSLQGVILTERSHRGVRNLFVTGLRDVQAIKNEVVLRLVEYLFHLKLTRSCWIQ